MVVCVFIYGFVWVCVCMRVLSVQASVATCEYRTHPHILVKYFIKMMYFYLRCSFNTFSLFFVVILFPSHVISFKFLKTPLLITWRLKKAQQESYTSERQPWQI